MGHLERKILIFLVICFFIAGLDSFEETYPDAETCESDTDCLKGKAKCIRGECHCTEKLAIGDGKKECKGATLCPYNFCKIQKSGNFNNSYCLINPATNKKVCKCNEGSFGRANASKCVKADAMRQYFGHLLCLSARNCPKYSTCYKNTFCSCLDELAGDGLNCRPPPPKDCTSNSVCHATHGECFRGICHCVGMYVGNGVFCREAAPCPSFVICEPNARCMIDPLFPNTPKCVCEKGYVKNKLGICELSCRADSHCPKRYSICVDKFCWCREELILGRTSCDPAPLHPCKTDKDCHSKAKCIWGKCYCQGNYVGNGKNCRESRTCTQLRKKVCHPIPCMVDPLRPVHAHCKCSPGFLFDANARQCVGKTSSPWTAERMYVFEETYPEPAPCNSDKDCLKGKAKCIRGECHCTEELAIGDGKNECKVAGVTLCPHNFCAMRNSDNFTHSYCLINPATNRKVCKCNEGYFGRAKASKCLKADAKTSVANFVCLTDKNCPAYSTCLKGYDICICREELIGDGLNCTPDYPLRCHSHSVCYAVKGLCYRGICHCDGMTIGNGRFCRVGAPCPKKMECGPIARCMVDPMFPKTQKCVCKKGYYRSKETGNCELTCTEDKFCTKMYSICVRHVCTCPAELILGRKSCDPAPLHPCERDHDCHPRAKCEYGECHCQGIHVGNGKNCRESGKCKDQRLRDFCGHDSICMVDPLRNRHAYCKCGPGYHFNADTKKCVDCLRDVHCTKTHSICVNKTCGCKAELVLGNSSCEAAPLHRCLTDKDCDSRAKCDQGKCICQRNTIGNGQHCRDIQACPAGHQCVPHSYCVADPLLPDKPVCRCDVGYRKSADGNCQDVDECRNGTVTCPKNSFCKNLAGSYGCECNKGYQEIGNRCMDVDECNNTGTCPENSVCKNSDGSYVCECNTGYRKYANICVECTLNEHCWKTYSICFNNTCTCREGFVLGNTECEPGPLHSCKTDKNCSTWALCEKGKCICQGKTVGSGKYCRESLQCPKAFDCGPNGTCLKDPWMFKHPPVCRCEKGSYKNINGQCVECTWKGHCWRNYSICVNERCTCKEDLVLKEKSCEAGPLHPCTSDKDCNSKAKCEGGKCHCQGNYVGGGRYCRASKPCPKDFECGSRGTCLKDPLMPKHPPVCRCNNDSIRTTDGKCVECTWNGHCPKTYSICANETCTCEEDLVLKETSCEAGPLHPCKSNNDCNSRAKCEGGKCYCQGNYVGGGKYCRASKPCPKAFDCGPYGICLKDPLMPGNQPVCRCENGSVKNMDGKCVECTMDGHCWRNYSICVNENCTCKEDLVLKEKSCEAGPLHPCKSDEDCNPRAKCDEGKCICQGKTVGGGKYCRDSQPCPKNFDCGPFGTCLKDPLMPTHSPVCRCENGSVKNEDGQCVECVSDSDCGTTYSTCVNEICKCKDELIKEARTCKRAPLLPCANDADCHAKADCIQGKCYCGKTSYMSSNQAGNRSRVRYTGNGQFCRETQACPGQDHCGELEACIVDPLFPNDRECKCREGTAKVSLDGKCEVVNECFKGGVVCPGLSSCKFVNGTYVCVCNAGYKMMTVEIGKQTLKRCLDVDECITSRPCPLTAVCINTEASYECRCNEGYRNNAVNKDICDDVDECSEMLNSWRCGDNQTCINLPGSYTCLCASGYVWSAGGCIKPGRDVSEQVCRCRDNWECNEGKCKCKEGYSPCMVYNSHWIGPSPTSCQRTSECPNSWSDWAPKNNHGCSLLCCC